LRRVCSLRSSINLDGDITTERAHGDPRSDRFALAPDTREPVPQPRAQTGRRAVACRCDAHAARAGAAHPAESMGARDRGLVGIPVRVKARSDPRRTECGRARDPDIRASPLRERAAQPRRVAGRGLYPPKARSLRKLDLSILPGCIVGKLYLQFASDHLGQNQAPEKHPRPWP